MKENDTIFNLHPQTPEYFAPRHAVSKHEDGEFGPDLTSNLACVLLNIKKASFLRVSSDKDPRGFVELYEGQPERIFTLVNNIRYKSLACYYDHFSFILPDLLPDLHAVVTVTPTIDDGLTMLIQDMRTKIILDTSKPHFDDFPAFLADRIRRFSKKNIAKEGKAE